MKTKEIFLSNESIANDFIKSFEYPFEVLPNIKEYIIKLGNALDNQYEKIGENIWIHKTAKVSKTAEIIGPVIIDEEAEIIGKNSVLGNSCEIKNSILYDYVQVPHFSYVGDSILGSHSHMGAGSIISNLRSDKKNIVIKNGSKKYETNMRKVGAFLGDNVEIGCGSVLNPGTIVMPETIVYPLTSVRGIIPGGVIVKNMDTIVKKIIS